jgi:hypothetical protein
MVGKNGRTSKVGKRPKKDESIRIRVTEEQKATLTAAALKTGGGVSSWLLAVGLKAADDGEVRFRHPAPRRMSRVAS